MLRNYLKIAFRSLVKRKLFSIINILGLSVGIAFALLIGIYVIQEKQVNADLRNVDNQYIVKSEWKVKEMGLDLTTIAPLPKAMREDYPNLVANYYRYNPVTNVVSAGDRHFKENIAIGDTTLVSMYGLELLHGDCTKAFRDDNSAVITETMARKLFDRTDVLNERISIATTLGDEQHYLVSAVLKDISKNSVTGLLNETYNVFVPTTGNRYYPGGDPAASWNAIYEIGFLELHPGVSPDDLKHPFAETLARHADEEIQRNLNVRLVPVRDYYLKDNNAAVTRVMITLSLVALFIISMAIINFININIGTSTYRLKEIGLRKVFGGAKNQLMLQYLTEAMMLTMFSGGIAIFLYEAMRPLFEQMLLSEIKPFRNFSFLQIIFFALLLIVVGFLAGIYPAFVLSTVNISRAVKGKMSDSKAAIWLRKSLLLAQFSLAILVFICGLTISRQVGYIFNKDLGYSKEQVLIATAFPKQWDSAGVQKMLSVREGLRQLATVKDVSVAFEIPDRKPPGALDLLAEGMNQPLLISALNVDEHYGNTFGLQLLAGSFFKKEGQSRIPGGIVLNESAAKAFGFTAENAIGKELRTSNGNLLAIRGVVRDFNYSSFSEAIAPLVFVHVEEALNYRYLAIRFAGESPIAAVDAVKAKWNELLPNAPFDFFFMDDRFQSLYKTELQLKKATSVATGLNLFIVLMGVFGIISFTIIRRNREIAVRKVLGADIKSILLLFVKEYAGLIIVANMIAWPIAYWFMHQWLQQYVYRIKQDMFPFIIAGASVFVLAVLLISLLSVKSATSSPVKNLRAE